MKPRDSVAGRLVLFGRGYKIEALGGIPAFAPALADLSEMEADVFLPLAQIERTKCKTPSWEFALPSALNNLFKAILHGEVTLMLAGVRFCAGGSRVCGKVERTLVTGMWSSRRVFRYVAQNASHQYHLGGATQHHVGSAREMNRMPTLSIVIPVFEANQVLETLYDRLIKTLTGLRCQFEIIFVEDGGRGQSWTFIEKLARQDDRVRGIRLSRNYGQHNALLCGIRAARFEIIVTMDDDLQHPPEELPKMLTLLLGSGQDVVYGTAKHPQHGAMRNLATLITKLALRTVMDGETVRHVSAFRVFRSEVVTSFRNYHGPFVSIDVLLTWGTSRFAGLYVRHEPRQKGTSGYTPRKLISHTLNLVTGLTPLPLRLASAIGLALSFVGLIIICYVLIVYFLRGSTVPGFPFLASVISVFSGAQLFAIGIIGEYLSRMHFRTMGKPSYVVRDDTGTSPKDTGVDGRSEDRAKILVE